MSDTPKKFDDVIGMLTHDCHVYALEIARLKAEVERLTKAGDEMAFHYQELVRIEWGSMTTHIPPSVVRWNAAKEGKQS